MPREEPAWWYRSQPTVQGFALAPIGHLFGTVARARYRLATAYLSKLPVICVGNFTAGGTGKTPVSLEIAERLRALGEKPAFLTRGYGGVAKGPVWVDGKRHTAVETGDEPLLLARAAPTLVARDRKSGAQAIEERGGATVIVMDDGLQNPLLAKDLTFAVVDQGRGLGNGRIIPAGPLRASLPFQATLCDAIILNGGAEKREAANELLEKVLTRIDCGPVLHAHVEATGDNDWIRGANILAFAGIGNPQRFFNLLSSAMSLTTVAFPDHQMLTSEDAQTLLDRAQTAGSILLTTEKDWVRLSGQSPATAELKSKTRFLSVRTVFDGDSAARLDQLIESALVARRARRSAL